MKCTSKHCSAARHMSYIQNNTTTMVIVIYLFSTASIQTLGIHRVWLKQAKTKSLRLTSFFPSAQPAKPQNILTLTQILTTIFDGTKSKQQTKHSFNFPSFMSINADCCSTKRPPQVSKTCFYAQYTASNRRTVWDNENRCVSTSQTFST